MARSGTFLTLKYLSGCQPLKYANLTGFPLLGIEITYYEMDHAIRYHCGPKSIIFVCDGVSYYNRPTGHYTNISKEWTSIKNDMYCYQYDESGARLSFKNIYDVAISSSRDDVMASVSTVSYTLVYVSEVHKRVRNYVTKLDSSWEDIFRTLKYFLELRAIILA